MSVFDSQGARQLADRPKRRAAICIALLLSLTSLPACSEMPPPGSGRVVDKDGKPVAGVHVLSWRKSSVMPWFPFSKPTTSCDAEHYSVTGDDGAFIIPSEVIKRPSSADASDMQIITYKSGLVGAITKFSPTPIFAPPNRLGVDIFPTKENPLVVEILVKDDLRNLVERQIYWNSVSDAAGCSCSGFSRTTWNEYLALESESIRLNPPPPPIVALRGDPVSAKCKMFKNT